MHLAIFEAHTKGHGLTHIRYLLPEALRLASRVSVVLPQGIEQAIEFRRQLEPFADSIDVVPTIRPGSRRRGPEFFRDIRSAVRDIRPDHLWVPTGDGLISSAAIAGLLHRGPLSKDVEGECGLIRMAHHLPPRGRRGQFRRWRKYMASVISPWQRFLTISPIAYRWVEQRGGPLAEKVVLVPDPLEPYPLLAKAEARRALGIPTDGRYIGAAGTQLSSARKGSFELVRAFAQSKLSASDRLLLAGEVGSELRELLRKEYRGLLKANRIVVLDEYLSEDNLMQALAAMDLVCTPYIGTAPSSGIVLRAAQMGRPVLTADGTWFADMVPRFSLGETVDPCNIAQMAERLRTMLDRSASYQTTDACRRLIEYSQYENFARLWSARLRQRLGQTDDSSEKTWAWVVGE